MDKPKRERARRKPKPRPDLARLWYTKAEVAALFEVNERTVEQWVSDGRLPAPVKRGAKWVRWPRHQIDALLRGMGARPEGSAT